MDCWRERNCFVKISDSIHPEEHSLRHCSSPRQVSALMLYLLRMNKSLYVKNVNFRPLPLDVNDCKKVKSKAFGPHCTRRQWDMLLTALSAAWYAGLTILGFFGNLIVFLTICLDRKLHLKRYVILASLALSDFLCGVLMNPFRSIARWKEAWVFGMPWCYANGILGRLSYTVTIAHLCAISYDRWVTFSHRPPQTDTTSNVHKPPLLLRLWLLKFWARSFEARSFQTADRFYPLDNFVSVKLGRRGYPVNKFLPLRWVGKQLSTHQNAKHARYRLKVSKFNGSVIEWYTKTFSFALGSIVFRLLTRFPYFVDNICCSRIVPAQ